MPPGRAGRGPRPGPDPPLALRRRAPVAVWVAIGFVTAAHGMSELDDPPVFFGALVAVYTVAAKCGRRTSAVAAAVTALAILVAVAGSGDSTFVDVALNYVVFGAAWVLGDDVSVRRAYTAELEDRAARLERQRQEEARRAAAEERRRQPASRPVAVDPGRFGAARRGRDDRWPSGACTSVPWRWGQASASPSPWWPSGARRRRQRRRRPRRPPCEQQGRFRRRETSASSGTATWAGTVSTARSRCSAPPPSWPPAWWPTRARPTPSATTPSTACPSPSSSSTFPNRRGRPSSRPSRSRRGSRPWTWPPSTSEPRRSPATWPPSPSTTAPPTPPRPGAHPARPRPSGASPTTTSPTPPTHDSSAATRPMPTASLPRPRPAVLRPAGPSAAPPASTRWPSCSGPTGGCCRCPPSPWPPCSPTRRPTSASST